MENTEPDIFTLFKETIGKGKLDGLKKLARDNELADSGLRWNTWQAFLGVFEAGNLDLEKRRKEYQKMKGDILDHFQELEDEAELNPLMIEKIEVLKKNS